MTYTFLTDIFSNKKDKKIPPVSDVPQSTPHRITREEIRRFNEGNKDIKELKEQVEKSSA